VEIYAEVANVLFKNIFGFPVVQDPSRRTENLGEFLAAWAELEQALRFLTEREVNRTRQPARVWTPIQESLRVVHKEGLFDSHEIREMEEFRRIRNLASHGHAGWESLLTREMVDKLQHWAKRIRRVTESGDHRLDHRA